MHSGSYINPSMRTHSDTSPVCGWSLGEESCRQATGRRASHRVILGTLGVHRRLSWDAVGLLCGPVQRKYQGRYARHVTVAVLILSEFLQIPSMSAGLRSFSLNLGPVLGCIKLGEMMRLTGGWEGKEALADFIVDSPILQSPRKRKKKASCQLCLILMVPCVSLCFHPPLHFSLIVVNNIQDGS